MEGRHTNNIPSTIPNQIQRRNGRLLRIPSHIRRDQRQQRHERRRTSLRHVVPDQPAHVITERQGDDEDHADDAG